MRTKAYKRLRTYVKKNHQDKWFNDVPQGVREQNYIRRPLDLLRVVAG